MMGYDVLLRSRPNTPLPPPPTQEGPLTLGQRAAEAVARTVGSWRFIIGQSLFIALWVTVNCIGLTPHWDPYPFILMNLLLSLQAAYTAPMILMSQNRQAEHDRLVLYGDYALDASTNQRTREMGLRLEVIEQHLADLVQARNQQEYPDVEVTLEE
jgi:uncharacterized membrane protein